MQQHIKLIIKSHLELRLFIFCFAAYNFTSLWLLAREALMSTLQPLVPHWYDPWSYVNEPTILLLASVLLLLNKKPGDLVVAMLSGYIFFQGLYLITFRIGWVDWLNSWIQGWYFILDPGFILVMWDFQIVFSLIVFSFSVFYLFQRRLKADAFLT